MRKRTQKTPIGSKNSKAANSNSLLAQNVEPAANFSHKFTTYFATAFRHKPNSRAHTYARIPPKFVHLTVICHPRFPQKGRYRLFFKGFTPYQRLTTRFQAPPIFRHQHIIIGHRHEIRKSSGEDLTNQNFCEHSLLPSPPFKRILHFLICTFAHLHICTFAKHKVTGDSSL